MFSSCRFKQLYIYMLGLKWPHHGPNIWAQNQPEWIQTGPQGATNGPNMGPYEPEGVGGTTIQRRFT